MVRIISQIGVGTRQCIVVAAMTTALVGCGGGSGDTDMSSEPTVDLNGDGVIDSLDADVDGDLIADVDDNFIDLDGDGLDDFTFLTAAEAEAAANTGDNAEDLDGDGFTDVSAANQCGSESGTDNDSSTATWADNCTIERSLSGGQFADSLYAAGIQRVAFCSGFGAGSVDGEFGPASEAAVQAFQRDEGLVDDGVVGADTWTRLQDRISLLTTGEIGGAPDAWGFSEGDCADVPMFYQFTSASEDGLGVVLGRWELAKNAPNADQRVPFSIGSPFGQL